MTSGPEEGAVCVDLDDILNLDDLEKAAARVLDAQDFDYYAGGEGDVRARRGQPCARGDNALSSTHM